MYPEETVKQLKKQLTDHGFIDLTTSEKVESILKEKGTLLLVINSVCGCAAGGARPGALLSLSNDNKPDHLATSFAGFDIEAVKTAREHLLPFPASSPAIALFKDGELVHMLERHHIEGYSPEMIAENLQQAYNEFC